MDKYPSLAPSTIPADTYRQLNEDHQTVGVFNFAIANKDLPDDLVYEIVKTVMDNHDRMKQIHSSSVERSEEHTSELPSLMRIPYAVFCLKKKTIHSL